MLKYKIFLLLISIVLTGILLFILDKRVNSYSYNVQHDYKYDFNSTSATVENIVVKNNKFYINKNRFHDYSVFMKLKIDTTLFGQYLRPQLKISSGTSSVTAYLEYGAKGVRYINITNLIDKSKSEFILEGKNLKIDNQNAKIIAFKNINIRNSKIMIIAPHPDDAEIAAYGFYSDYNQSYIVTITGGDAGLNNYKDLYNNKAESYLAKGKVRVWNSITVPLLGGIPAQQCLNLGFFDGTLDTMFANKIKVVEGLYTKNKDVNLYRNMNVSTLKYDLMGTSNWNSLVDNLAILLKKIHPGIIVTPYPLLDRHFDHKLSTVALFEAIKKSQIHNGKLYLYTNHYVLGEAYPEGEAGGTVSLPANFQNNIYFNSLYSHSLSKENQKGKILALDAMNDLRPNTQWRFPLGLFEMLVRTIKLDVFGYNHSYYKRSIRSNELFFIVDIDNIYNDKVEHEIIGF